MRVDAWEIMACFLFGRPRKEKGSIVILAWGNTMVGTIHILRQHFWTLSGPLIEYNVGINTILDVSKN